MEEAKAFVGVFVIYCCYSENAFSIRVDFGTESIVFISVSALL
jgi:hypothetical protein